MDEETGRREVETPLKFDERNSSFKICYHPEFGLNPDMLLLEVPEFLLPDLLHQRICLRGEPDEDAVLCTSSQTFGVKTVATSNSVFLIPPSADPAVGHVLKLVSSTMELHQIAPRTDKLRKILSQRPYNPQEDATTEDLYRWEDLVRSVQASDDELRASLKSLSAIEIDGNWRLVNLDYMDYMLSMLLSNSVLNDWSLDALAQDDVVSALTSDGIPPQLALHCLSVFAHKNADSDFLWKINNRGVCVHYAHRVLRCGKQKLEHFMGEWSRKVPEGMHASFDMLEGEVLTEKLGAETWVRSFSVSSLPSNPADRFSILFKEMPRWEWKDLHPYVRDLSVPGLTMEALLIKYTRRIQPTPDADPVYCAR